MHILKGYTKQEISWMMYDWANSAHSVIIVTLLPIFLTRLRAIRRTVFPACPPGAMQPASPC